MKTSYFRIAVAAFLVGAVGCGSDRQKKQEGISPQQMADSLYTVLAADRAVYAGKVVDRLQNEDKIIKATEHWQEDKTLPLPAQMFRMGSEIVNEKKAGFGYALLSLWAINKQNLPKTDAEKKGLQIVADQKGAGRFYTNEVLGGETYFTAIYPDLAVSRSCTLCHNKHAESPRNNFNIGDVMGGVVIRIRMSH